MGLVPLRLSRSNALGLLRPQKVPAPDVLVSSRKGYTSFGGAAITLRIRIETQNRSPGLNETGALRLICWIKPFVPSPTKGVKFCEKSREAPRAGLPPSPVTR